MKNCFSGVLHYGRVVDTLEICFLDYFCKFHDEKFGRIVQSENLMNKCPLGSVHASFTPHEMRVVCMPRRRMMKAGVDGRET